VWCACAVGSFAAARSVKGQEEEAAAPASLDDIVPRTDIRLVCELLLNDLGHGLIDTKHTSAGIYVVLMLMLIGDWSSITVCW